MRKDRIVAATAHPVGRQGGNDAIRILIKNKTPPPSIPHRSPMTSLAAVSVIDDKM